ncbi:PAP2-domain-containing protein [Tilletiaria anomala UBC 951]|uniref:Dolichyldiphosphatase n=1 Tax=Tilletiaria anomala (strain ATCC 24038 / CBS 436.72 / UBC 951) TaxID=1037660 RepID=A0A066WBP1_TILAU|nr:PAP2-domain-containing protein [Tilletiaria anomala UBC 951]KDN51332.1 PAP2-domain-containing protein [Tilletiaria anomala UBC 951]
MPRESAIDPERYVSLGLTHVQYDAGDPAAKLLGLVTLSPIFLLCAYVTIILYRRELTFINALIGQLGCEGLNWFLKRLIRQPRPFPGMLGKGYGMPSSHSQFVGFFAAFFISHFLLHHPQKTKPATLINTMRRAEHVAVIIAIVLLSALTCYSRYHLAYHTPVQILVGLTIGVVVGGGYYYLTEIVSRQPLRLPAPLGSPTVWSMSSSPILSRPRSPVLSHGNAALGAPKDEGLRKRSNSASRARGAQLSRRKSSLSSMLPPIPDLHPAPPLRQMILDHPVAVAFRVRDSWTVWRDGGIEGEYGTWRREWESRREWSWDKSASKLSLTARMKSGLALKPPQKKKKKQLGAATEEEEADVHYQHMLHALRLANKCEPTQTAFCVGCIITAPSLRETLATGYSRELEGNTHAEQCALDKLQRELIFVAENEAEAAAEIAEELALDLYTTMEPCSERISGATPCVQRILEFNHQRRYAVWTVGADADAQRCSPQPQQSQQVRHPQRCSKFVRLHVARVFQGVSEPDDFVQECQGARMLREQGISVQTVRARKPLFRVQNDRQQGEESESEDWSWLEKECLRIAKYGHADQPQPQPGVKRLWML